MEKRRELEQLLMMAEHEVLTYAVIELEKFYERVDSDYDNYVIACGTSPIALVAHVDTVSWGTKGMTLAWNKNVLRNEQGILGADDRAGVFGILEAVRKAKHLKLAMPTIIFTNHEESGGRGVKQFIKDKVFTGEDINLFVELDRKGCNEYVFYTSSLPKQVMDYVESFGFCKREGSYSDIMDLAFAYKIPAVNLSVGYYSQHTQAETLHWDEMWLTINRVVEMLVDPIPVLYRLSETDCRSWAGGYSRYTGNYHGGNYGYGADYGYGDYYDSYTGNKVVPFKQTDLREPIVLTPEEREWPTDNEVELEVEEITFDNSTELEFVDMLKTEVYCAVIDDEIDTLYYTYFQEIKVTNFLENFFDLFDYELHRKGYTTVAEIGNEEFEEVFDSIWNLCLNVYGDKF